MADTFQSRMPTLSDEALRAYLDGHARFKLEAIEAAAAELRRRGQEVPEARLDAIRAQVRARDTVAPAVRPPGLLWDGQAPRMARIRILTGALLAAGFATAAVLYRRAAAAAAAPFDLEPQDSKAYLRQVEMMGGKANLVASGIRQWFTGLFQGTNLAFTICGLTLAAAAVLWLAATSRGRAR